MTMSDQHKARNRRDAAASGVSGDPEFLTVERKPPGAGTEVEGAIISLKSGRVVVVLDDGTSLEFDERELRAVMGDAA